MMCEECGKNPATVHVTKVYNGQKMEMHLCEGCAREKGEFDLVIGPPFSLPQLLSSFFDYEHKLPEPARVCRICGLSFDDFSKSGFLGCSRCYSEFGNKLEPVIRRIHGSVSHVGKAPRRITSTRASRIEKLRSELQECIKREEFERAAEIRDEIRRLEADGGEIQ